MKRYPLAALVEASGLSEARLAARVGIGGSTLKVARQLGFTEAAADRYACRAGFVPWHVWPEWIADVIADVSIPCVECNTPFVPKRKGQRFCERRCSARAWKRERYQSDPEFAQRCKDAAKAHYEECGHYIQGQARKWRDANPERVKASRRAYYEANRDAENDRQRAWYEANAEDQRAKARRRYEENRERHLAACRAYYQANAEKLKAKQRERYRAKAAA